MCSKQSNHTKIFVCEFWCKVSNCNNHYCYENIVVNKANITIYSYATYGVNKAIAATMSLRA